jgi:hypothetical protein
MNRALGKKSPIEADCWSYLESQILLNRLCGYSGADLGAIVKQSALQAILNNQETIKVKDFEVALK